MSKVKKLLAMLMAVVMTLGMSVTAFAAQVAEPVSTITVSNLAAGVTTTVDLINIIYYDVTTDADGVERQSWIVQNWAIDYIKLDSESGAFKITDLEGLKSAVEGQVDESSDYYEEVSETTKTWTNVPIGAYAIYASDTKGVYSLMVANTYDNENKKYLASKPANVTAKMDSYKIDKTTSDSFVHRGQEVTFTIKTQLPARTNEVIENGVLVKKELTQFEIVDTPNGLDIQRITFAKIGTTNITNEITSNMITKTSNNDGETTEYKINLLSFMDQMDGNNYKYASGETIEIQYTAIVMNDQEYNNNVDVTCNTVDYDEDGTKGFEANITVTKVDENGQFLTGAEFQVVKGNETLWFIKEGDGVYKRALSQNEVDATQTLIVNSTNGTLKVTGLDEGTYIFKETKAPEGYSGGVTKDVQVDANNKQVTIPAGENTNIMNTKLASLPETGGIGTTIFTIGGCLTMIIAAGLFFATRKKAEK